MSELLLEVRNLYTAFDTAAGKVSAVRGISFDVKKGESLGIVGESGCGKSVSMLSVMRLLEDNARMKAEAIRLDGEDLLGKTNQEMRKVQGNEIGMIFQDPMTSLNPLFTVEEQICSPLMRHQNLKRKEAREKALRLLDAVGIPSPERRLKQYPHELSGGMKQRVMIAIALVSRPSLVICDEPTTSLDVTIEAQILDLLLELREKLGTSIIMITHDLGVIARMCDRVIVMYGGKVVEKGTASEIFYNTAHPYTKGLMQSIAKLDTQKGEKLKPIEGTPPDLFFPPKGCPFAARCEYAMDVCKDNPPLEYQVCKEHVTSCWLQHEYAPDTDIKKQGAVAIEKGEVK